MSETTLTTADGLTAELGGAPVVGVAGDHITGSGSAGFAEAVVGRPGHVVSAPRVRDRLQAGLVAAMKAKDRVAVAAIRSALAAVANAEAVPGAAPTTAGGTMHVAGAERGVGAGDVPRRELSELDVVDLVDTEIADRRAHADEYDTHGQSDAAERLRAEAAVLEGFLEP